MENNFDRREARARAKNPAGAAATAGRSVGAPGGPIPRVAFFTDSYHEANGVALTSRQFSGYAKSRFFPFFSVHAGPKTAHWKRGNFETFELETSRAVLNLEHDLKFDLAFLRHRKAVRQALALFRPDLIHVTGPGHMGLLGALLAYDLKVPLVASWHTNVHEFGGRRLEKMLGHLGSLSRSWTPAAVRLAERGSLEIVLWFYRFAKLFYAPNPELVDLLHNATGREVHLMQRGIDTGFYTPERRTQPQAGVEGPDAPPVTIGYVGRLSAEKNVREIQRMDAELRSRGVRGYRFSIVGEGSEREWLREHLQSEASLPGLLRGDPVADAYANMDVFLFPSETDTFGNVILEALASGLPCVVSNHGGPKFLVEPGETGFIANSTAEYADALQKLIADRGLLGRMRTQARQASLKRSWDQVFEGVYAQYRHALASGILPRVNPRTGSPSGQGTAGSPLASTF